MCLSINTTLFVSDLAAAHPSCDDSQLFVMEGKDKKFTAVNYIRVDGSRFLIFPVKNEHVDKITEAVAAECLAESLNKFIAQSQDEKEVPVYRSLSGGEETASSLPVACSIVAKFRSDGSILFIVDFSKLQKPDVVVVAAQIRTAIQTQIDSLPEEDSKEKRKTLEAGLASMTFDLVDGAPDSLHDVLSTLAVCIEFGMSCVIGMLPEDSKTGAFVLTFEDIPLVDGFLEVPALSLIHEDATSPASEGVRVLYEHLNQVRSSYWVCAATNLNFNTIEIEHSPGTEYENDLTIKTGPFSTDAKRMKTVKEISLMKTKTGYPAGVDSVSLYTCAQIDGTFGEDSFAEERKKAEEDILKKLTDEHHSKLLQVEELDLRVANMALARTGKRPIASIGLRYINANDDPRVVNMKAKEVRKRLQVLAAEKLYEKSNWAETEALYEAPDMGYRSLGAWW